MLASAGLAKQPPGEIALRCARLSDSRRMVTID